MPGHCSWGATVECEVADANLFVSLIWAVGTLAYCFLFGFYLWHAHRQLKRHLYQRFRMVYLSLQLQVLLRPLPGLSSCLSFKHIRV